MLIIVWGFYTIYQKYVDTTPQNNQNECQEANCEEDENGEDPEAIQVSVLSAELTPDEYQSTANTFTKTGQIIANQEIEVYPELSGLIDQIQVYEGSQIKAGDTLATLKDSAQLDQAIANYNSALSQLSNAQKTLQLTKQSGQITQSTYQNQIKSAQNNIQSALLNLESSKFLRYEQYRLEDSKSLQQAQTQKLQQLNPDSSTKIQGIVNEYLETQLPTPSDEEQSQIEQLGEDIKYNQNFNTIQSRYIQEQQGAVQDQQNSIKVDDTYNQLNLLSKQLASSQVQSDLQSLNIDNQIIQIQTQLELAKISLESGEITSPINGIVTRVNIKPGEKVSPQNSLFVITDFNSLIAETYLSPEEVLKLTSETTVEVNILDQTVQAEIISVALTADPISKTIPVKILPKLTPETPVFPNTFATITFSEKEQNIEGNPNAFTVSTKVLYFKKEGIYIAVAEDNKVVHKKIDLSLPIKNGRTAIKSGLTNNDQIITNPVGLAAGTLIETD